mgnify:CR=1 FL=1
MKKRQFHDRIDQAIDAEGRFQLARFGKLDTLVNNAAGNFLAPAATLTPAASRRWSTST